jgi:hypothetical protein
VAARSYKGDRQSGRQPASNRVLSSLPGLPTKDVEPRMNLPVILPVIQTVSHFMIYAADSPRSYDTVTDCSTSLPFDLVIPF